MDQFLHAELAVKLSISVVSIGYELRLFLGMANLDIAQGKKKCNVPFGEYWAKAAMMVAVATTLAS